MTNTFPLANRGNMKVSIETVKKPNETPTDLISSNDISLTLYQTTQF